MQMFIYLLLCINACYGILQVAPDDDIEQKLAAIEKEQDGIRERIQQMMSQRLRKAAEKRGMSLRTTSMAFSATTFNDRSLAMGDTLTYDWTFVNEGNHFDTDTGVFTCPGLEETYLFTVSIQSPFADISKVTLTSSVSGDVMHVVTYVIDPVDDSGIHTNSIVLQCEAGETLSVVATGDSDTVNIKNGAMFIGHRI